MKKLILGLLAAMLMTAGLVASVGSSTAQAAPYPASVDTKTGLSVTPVRNGPPRRTFTATVSAKGSSARPDGVFVFRFKRVGGGAQFATRSIKQGTSVTLTRVFKVAGTYNVRAFYQAEDGSIFKDSRSTNIQFRVKRG